MDVTIYHNPACGTSRNTLEMIRNLHRNLGIPAESLIGA